MKGKFSILFSLIAILSVLGYTSYTYFTPQQSEINLITAPTGSVSISLTTPPEPLIINTDYTLTLKYSSPTQSFTAISANLTYNPDQLQLSNFVASSNFPTTLQAPKFENGKLSFALGVKPELNAGLRGAGAIATFKLKPLQTGTFTLDFADPTLVAVTESNTNALLSANSVSMVVKNPPLVGDLNNDDTVNLLDFNELVTNFGNPYTIFDFNSLLVNFGKNR